MAYMEQNKYLKPHLSYCFDGLAIRIREEIPDDQSIAFIKSNNGSDDEKPTKRSPSTKTKMEAIFESKKRVQSQPTNAKSKTKHVPTEKANPLPNITKYNTKKRDEARELNNQTSPLIKSAKKNPLKHLKIEVSEIKAKLHNKKKKKHAKRANS